MATRYRPTTKHTYGPQWSAAQMTYGLILCSWTMIQVWSSVRVSEWMAQELGGSRSTCKLLRDVLLRQIRKQITAVKAGEKINRGIIISILATDTVSPRLVPQEHWQSEPFPCCSRLKAGAWRLTACGLKNPGWGRKKSLSDSLTTTCSLPRECGSALDLYTTISHKWIQMACLRIWLPPTLTSA